MIESPGAARAAGVDEKTRAVPSAAAPATFDIDLVTAKPWQPGHPEQLGLPQNAETVAASTANTHSFIFELCLRCGFAASENNEMRPQPCVLRGGVAS